MAHDMPSMGSSLDFHFLSMGTVRGLWLLPLILMTGIVGFRLFVFNPLSELLREKSWGKEIQYQVGSFSLRWVTIFLLLFAFMSVTALFQETEMITGKKMWGVFPYLLTVLEKTHWGRAWADRFILLIVFGMFWGSCLKREKLPFHWFFVLLVFISATFSMIGHPADKGDFTWRVANDVLHLVLISLWIGGLLPLFYLLGMIKAWNLPEMNPFLTRIVERFSTLAVTCVSLVVGTGLFAVWNSWGQFPTWELLLSSNYGNFFLIKMFFVLGVLACGGLSRFYILPGLRKTSSGNPTRLVNRFFIFLAIELVFSAGVLISAFFLTQSTPPFIPLNY